MGACLIIMLKKVLLSSNEILALTYSAIRIDEAKKVGCVKLDERVCSKSF